MGNYVSKVLAVAKAEVGYLEKANGNSLYDKTANAGSANYTKYGFEMHEVYPQVMDYPAAWCDAFVDWCFYKAYGVANAKALIGGQFNDYTVASANLYKNKGAWHTTPKVGDQVFFKNSSRICHTGLVWKVTDTTVYTIEGNTSSAAGVVANGGAVAEKSYPIGYAQIAGYGRPKYDEEKVVEPAGDVSNAANEIAEFQRWLNRHYVAKLTVDGEFGPLTKKAALKAFQKCLNATCKTALVVDGIWGPKTQTVAARFILSQGAKGNGVYLLQGMLYCKGYDPKGFDGIFGSGCKACVKKYQKAEGLDVDGVVGKQVWTDLFA